MNSNREDYLKIIYEEGGLKSSVSNKVIAEKLQVAAGSVSEMLSKLNKAGLIESTPQRGVKLTKAGLKICFNVVRSHRLWEVFLIRHLNYSWRDAHEDAHLLEHVATERMVDRLDKFLNFPQTCPHGGYIPRTGETLSNEIILEKLSDMETHEDVKILKIVEDGELLDYVETLGVKIGEEIRIVSKGAYEGSVSFMQGDRTISMSHKAATQIYVKRI